MIEGVTVATRQQGADVATVSEAAAMLRCSNSTVYAYLRVGKLRSSQPGASGKHRRGGAPHRISIASIRALSAAVERLDTPPPAPPTVDDEVKS
jgi:excisionase family DNA binding protein